MKNRFWIQIFRFIPSLIWMSIIFYFSSRSTTGIGTNATDRFLILKSFHLIEYAVLAILLFFGFLKYKHAIITAYLYALTDEFHQSFVPARTSKFQDTLIDLIGIFFAMFLLNLIIKKYKNVFNIFFNNLPKKT